MLPGIMGLAGKGGDGTGGGGGSSQFGALVHKSTGDQTIGTSATALNWDVEDYDSGGLHDTSSNTSRFTIPASGVSLIALTSNVKNATNDPLLQHNKNGASFVGMGKADSNGGSTNYTNIVSAPIAVSSGDYFETLFNGSAGTNTPNNDEETWASIYVMDSATKYAIVKNSGSLSLSAGTNTTLSFDTETVDTNAFHDNVTNPSRLTVPSGVSLVRLRANAASGSVAGQFFLFMNKNGATARGLPMRDCDTSAEENLNLISAPLEVTAGDYFELVAFATNATSVPSANNCWFSIEEVKMPATYQRALVNKSTTQSIAANTFAVTLTWDQEVYDTASMHDNVTNNSRLTVPSGCTKARPIVGIKTSSANSEMSVLVRKNGADYFGMPRYNCDTAGTDNLNVAGAWVDVSPGDYFEALFYSFAGCTVGTDNETFFCLECI